MGRKAYISSDMAHDEKLYDVSSESPNATLLWPWIVTYFDDWGRALRSPKRIKSQLFPNVDVVTVESIDEALTLFAKYGLIQVYGDEMHQYMAVPSNKWFKWQTHIRSEKRVKDNSKYPSIEEFSHSRACDDEQRARARTSDDFEDRSEETEVLSEKHIPSPSPSLTPSLTSTDDDDLRTRPTSDIYDRVEGIMQIRLVKHNYLLQREDRAELTKLLKDGFTDDQIFSGIAHAFELYKPKTFKYCAEVIRTLRETMDAYKQAAAAGGERGGSHKRDSAKNPIPISEYRKDKPGAY